ncbi:MULTISPECIES: hypothetical protein [unclassified Haladaptatus]|uniref:hypothetical protein n=1 Tax=unclassified Haladaptatus TaxID=2622732 RepID=UPI0023E7EC5A|nr:MULTISPECIES: hypothetical protein [unclassified Haladaptatus]
MRRFVVTTVLCVAWTMSVGLAVGQSTTNGTTTAAEATNVTTASPFSGFTLGAALLAALVAGGYVLFFR